MYSIETSREQYPTLSVIGENNKKLYIHSRVAPMRDCTLFEAELDERYDYIIILGIGLGYQLAPLQQVSNSSIILIDRIAQIERELAGIAPSSWITTQQNITIFSGKGPEELALLLQDILDIDEQTRLKILTHPASSRAFPAYYGEVQQLITQCMHNKIGNLATKKAFGLQYLRNSIKKLHLLHCLAPVKVLEHACEHMPALVVSSAPSLDYEIEWIAAHQDRCIVVAVDSALPVLAKYNISADFFVTIDPQPWIYEHFIESSIQESFGITALSAWNIPLDPEHTFLSSNSHPFSQALERYCGDCSGSIDSKTGNVAGDALNSAFLLGCNPVYLVGVDFSFPCFNIYARGTAYQHRYTSFFNSRFRPVETCNAEYIVKSSKKLRVKGKYTRQSFLQYNKKLSGFLSSIPARKIVHINSLGLPLKGVAGTPSLTQIDPGKMQKIDKQHIRYSIKEKAAACTRKISSKQVKAICENKALMDQVIKYSLSGDSYQKRGKQLLSRLGEAASLL